MMHVGKSSLLLDGKIGSRKYKIINATYWLSHIFCHHCQITQGTGDLHTSKTTRRKTSKVIAWLAELFMKNRPFSLYLKSGKILHCSELLYKTRLGTSIYSQFLSTCSTIGKLFVIYLNSFLSTTQNCSLRAKRRATRESGYCAPASLLGYWEISRTAFYWWREKGSKEEKGRWNESYKEIGRTH